MHVVPGLQLLSLERVTDFIKLHCVLVKTLAEPYQESLSLSLHVCAGVFDILKIYIKFTTQNLQIVIHILVKLVKVIEYFPTNAHYKLIFCNYKF